MKVTVKSVSSYDVKINTVVYNQNGVVVGLFPLGSDAVDFMERCGYSNGTKERVADHD